MLVTGLTGGIASGKTAVSDAFARLGAPIIDTDVIARELVRPGEASLQRIAATFGSEMLLADGTLDRAALRALVFSDSASRRQLNAILHPEIRKRALRTLQATRAPYCILVVPLLVESGMIELVDRVLLIDVPESLQLERLTRRDGTTTEQAQRILQAQANRAERLRVADDVIENSGGLADLQQQVRGLDHLYRRLSVSGDP